MCHRIALPRADINNIGSLEDEDGLTLANGSCWKLPVATPSKAIKNPLYKDYTSCSPNSFYQHSLSRAPWSLRITFFLHHNALSIVDDSHPLSPELSSAFHRCLGSCIGDQIRVVHVVVD